ncbi:MAG: 30S ribosomal protein S9 [bacterium]
MSAEKNKGTEKYIEAVGRRKTAIARVRMTPATKNSITVNDKALNEFFTVSNLQKVALEALEKYTSVTEEKFSVIAKTIGGGMAGQAEAVRHGIARAIIKHAPHHRTTMKKEGFLTRDQRAKERRKFGLKKARKAPQWSKR